MASDGPNLTHIAELVKRLQAELPKKCTLCDRRPKYFGKFRWKTSAANGRQYAVCGKCWRLSTVMKLIEAKLLEASGPEPGPSEAGAESVG
jgi:hypothetical protein